MSTEIQEKEVVKIKQSESLISKRRRKILVDPLDDNNPISIQVLGICSYSQAAGGKNFLNR